MSREAARDYVLGHAAPGSRILDIGAGESPFAEALLERGCSILAVDRDEERLLEGWHRVGKRIAIIPGDVRSIALPAGFNLVLAIYSLQHMISYEPAVWVRIREKLAPGASMIYCGRYRKESPCYEGDRGDPLISNNESTLAHLAMLTGFRVADFRRYRYLGNEFSADADRERANMFGSVLEAV